ncbi:DUF222 domain-containing protein [Mycobacterium sp. pW049]|uniref:HNH endonuclease signature motif containing protein n=1 Tax=[Mycobacterium] bulgaricum TaxID=3238985 RepID=UPI00351BE1BB
MFEELIRQAERSRGAAVIGAWARVENAGAARRLSAMADLLAGKLADKDSAERDQWCLDNWDAVSAEVAAAQGVSMGVASNELLDAWALRERLPRVSEVFASGAISYRHARAVVKRTKLVKDSNALAKIDTEIAAQIAGWGTLSKAKLESEIDYWVDRYDPAAVVRAESADRSHHVDVVMAEDGSGVCFIEAVLCAHDGEVMDRRLDEMARGVCARDPRPMDKRRAAALGAVMAKADRLQCHCGAEDCAAAERTPTAVIVHVVAEEASLADDTPVLDPALALDPDPDPEPDPEPEPEPESALADPSWGSGIAELLSPAPATGPAQCNPAKIVGGAILPAPQFAATLAKTATLKWIVHPRQAPPEPRYVPSAKLAEFVRCRDLTCRFPGCDVPSFRCDLDHTIAYPAGPTQASNLKALCRKHHLLKTFWGWRDAQSPDGTVVWTSPEGQTFTDHPRSRVLFPALCRPTAAVNLRPNGEASESNVPSGLGMPRRTLTRAQAKARSVDEQRRINEALLG